MNGGEGREGERDLVQGIAEPFVVTAEVVRMEPIESVDGEAHDLVVVVMAVLHVRAGIGVGLLVVAFVVRVVGIGVLRPVHP